MKRVDRWRRLYFKRVIAKRTRRKAKSWRRKRQLKTKRAQPNVIKAPQKFDLEQPKPRSKLVSFLTELRREVIGAGKAGVTIDFTDTRHMWATGTLLFRAELCRLRRITNGAVKLRCLPPRNPKVAQVLKQTGIFRALGHRSSIKPSYSDVVHWRYAEGNGAQGAKYDEILGQYDGTIPPSVASGLYLGLTEAMTNCHHHAYIAGRQDGLDQVDEPKEWWMFSQERDGRLSVAFCDLGVGIPETLPLRQPRLWERLKSGGVTDAVAIIEAIKYSQSRTQKHYRGRGLRQLVEVIENTPGAMLLLFSNRGCYVNRNGTTSVRDFRDSILGTLIAWSVPVNAMGLTDD
jgi:hypothetical protein